MRRITNELRLLAFIDSEARAGRPSPKNDAICDLFGLESNSSATELVTSARRRGFIETIYPSSCSRVLTLTAAGERRLSELAVAEKQEPLFTRQRGVNNPVDVSLLTPLADDDRGAGRQAAENANARFLAALAKVTPVGDVRDRDTGRFNRLPPPAMTAEAFS